MNIGVDFEELAKKATIVTEQYSRMPNFIIDDMYMAQLSDKAYKCYSLILRQTVRFNRSSTSIATETFKKYCGIKKDDTVYKCIREIEQLKLISVTRATGTTNHIKILPNPSHETVLPLNGTTPIEREGTTPIEREGTTPIERDPIKENIKENIKESANRGNAPDEILNIWTPDLHSLNSWLQRSGLPKINQVQAEEILLEINPHYEDKILSGLATDTKMYSNFVKWVKRDNKLVEKLFAENTKPQAAPNPQNLAEDMGDW